MMMNVAGKTYVSSVRLSSSRNRGSRRDALVLAGTGLAGPLLRAVSLAETKKETIPMRTIKVGQENSQPIEIYNEDHGSPFAARNAAAADGVEVSSV
jgi:hypothetical protein